MSDNKCKFCNGSGWYEPKNMGGMMVEPCNRCDAGKAIQSPRKQAENSPDKCPVCGCAKDGKGGCTGWITGPVCENAEHLAIERAKEIERLKAALERIANQPSASLKSGWKHWSQIAQETLTETKPNQEK